MHPLNQPPSDPSPSGPPPAAPGPWQSPWALDADQPPAQPVRKYMPAPYPASYVPVPAAPELPLPPAARASPVVSPFRPPEASLSPDRVPTPGAAAAPRSPYAPPAAMQAQPPARTAAAPMPVSAPLSAPASQPRVQPAPSPVPVAKRTAAPLPESVLKPSMALATSNQHAMHARITAAMAQERRRRMGRLLMGTILAFAVTLVAWVYLQDEKPVSDADMTPEPPLASVVPPRALDRLKLALDSAHGVEAVDQIGKPAWEWETPLLSRTVQANAASFDNIRDMLSEDDWQTRHPVWQITDLSSEPQWETLGLAKSAAIAYFLRRGDDQAALQTALDLATFAKRLQGIYTWPNYYPRGIELHERACEAIAEMLRTTRLTSFQLGQMQFQFERAAPSDAMLRTALKSYYQFERRLIVGLRAGDPWDQIAPPLPMARQGRLFFKPNETLRTFYKAFKGLEDEVQSVPYARIDPLKAIIGPEGKESNSPGNPNSRGERYAHQRLWSYGQLVERQGLQVARHLVVLTQFAVRRYAQDRGHLPKVLGDLVPTYFTELPNDPYSGKPLSYDAAKGLIYSVGTDVRDGGGHVTPIPLSDSLEPTVVVE